MATPVVIVASGGIAVTEATVGTPLTPVADGGFPVTIVTSGGLPIQLVNVDGSAYISTPAAPVNTGSPAISAANYYTGTTLAANRGSWTGSPAPTYAYQWKRDGVNIGSATASTYVLVSADETKTITVAVTATNTEGNATATSAGIVAAVLPVAPAFTVNPSISGTATEGQVLTASDGTYSGTPTPTATRVWKRSGVAISGATATTYTLVTADVGSTITVTVTATNTAGSAGATSTATATIAAAATGGLPAGALGVWYMDEATTTNMLAAPNEVATKPVSQSLVAAPRRSFTSGPWWAAPGTVVDNAAAAPDGSMEATTMVVASGNYWLELAPTTITMAAGTYTMAISVRSRSGASQTAVMTNFTSGSSDTRTITTSWSRVTHTFTIGSSGAQRLMWLKSPDGTTGINVEIVDAELFIGSSDLNTTWNTASPLDGHMYFGPTKGDTDAVLASGAVDLTGSKSYGTVQFGTIPSVSTFTLCTLVKKKGTSTATFQPLLSKMSDWGNFTLYTEYSESVGHVAYDGAANGVYAKMAPLAGDQYHVMTQRYDGTHLSVFIDDVQLSKTAYAQPAAKSLDLLLIGAMQVGAAFAPDYLMSSMAFYGSALTDAQVRTVASVFITRAATNGLSVSTLRILQTDGDSIMAGNYPGRYAAISSPKVYGNNWAVAGTGVSDAVTRSASYLPFVSVKGSREFIFLSGIGGNGINSPSQSAWRASLLSYYQSIRAAGYTLAVMTFPPRDASFNTSRATENAWIRSLLGTEIDIVIDFDLEPNGMGLDAGSSNTAWYSDGVHPTETGQQLIADYITTQLNVIGGAADTTPNAFTFTDQTGVVASTLTESAAITVSGITAASAISVTGGEYQIGAGSWTSSAGTVTNGQTVKVRHTSSGTASTATNTVLTIGGVSDTFTTTTAGAGGGSPLSFSTLFVGDATSMVTSGGKVTTWNTLDGGAVSFAQSDASKQPAYSSGMVCDGTALYLERAAFSTGGLATLSIFALVDQTDGVSGNSGIFCFADPSGNPWENADHNNVTNLAFTSGGSGNGYRAVRGSTNIEVPGWTGSNRVGLVFDGVNGTGYGANIAGTTPTAFTANFASSVTAVVGGRASPTPAGNYWMGTIKKLVVTSLALDSTQRAEVDAWLLT